MSDHKDNLMVIIAGYEKELKDSVKNVLRSNRTPDEIVFLNELPYNETGKLLRRVLKENLVDLGDGSTV